MPCIGRKAAVPVALLLGVACTSDRTTGPSEAIPEAAVSDGAHGGNAHFYFLPPLVRAPSPSGTFDPSQSITVEICRLTGTACGTVVATFRSGDPEPNRISVSAVDEHYHANWKTSRDLAGSTYRIEVTAGTTVLGYADVHLATDRREAPQGLFYANPGSTVPIKFRIEEGAVATGAHLFGEAGTALAIQTEDADDPIVAFGLAGGSMVVRGDPETGEIAGASFSLPDGKSSSVYLKPDGTLDKAVFGDVIALFANQTATTIDIALISADGSIRVGRAVPLASAPPSVGSGAAATIRARAPVLSEVAALPPEFAAAAAETDITFTIGGQTVTQRDLEILSLAMSWASCTVVTFASAANPALLPGAFLTCGLAHQQWVAFAFGPTSAGTGAQAADAIMDVNGCARRNPFDCAEVAVATGSAIWDLSNAYLASQASNVQAGQGVLMAGSGDVQVTLTWDNVGDVDLHVTDPTGYHIYYADPVSPSGGRLDFDNRSGFGPENIFWPAGAAPAGAYQVSVVYYSGQVSPINFTVVVTANGATETYRGQVFAPGQSVPVVTFNVGAAATAAAAEPLPAMRRLLLPTAVVPLTPKAK